MAPGFGGPLQSNFFIAEAIYSFVIILCSLMIYFGTKEIYELSNHKGIKYFRNAFLFFACGYFFRSIIQYLNVFFNLREIFDIPFKFYLGPITLFIFLYFNSIAIFYLLYSVMWKKWKGNKIYLFHILAFCIAIIPIYSRNFLIYLFMNLILLLFVIFIVYVSYKQSNQKNKSFNLYIIYVLLFFFWVLNILDILIPRFFQSYHFFIYISSITLFLIILYKVLKKVGS